LIILLGPGKQENLANQLGNQPDNPPRFTQRASIDTGLSGTLLTLAISPDGKTVVAAGMGGGQNVRVFDVSTKQQRAAFDMPMRAYPMLKISYDGQFWPSCLTRDFSFSSVN
jgi:hypothetical protein